VKEQPKFDARLVRVQQAARYLGISPWSLRNMIQKGELQYVQFGDPRLEDDRTPWLLDMRDLDRLISTRKKKM